MDLIQLIREHEINLNEIPVLNYILFYNQVVTLLEKPDSKIECYCGFRQNDHIRMYCAISTENGQKVKVFSYILRDEPGMLVAAITAHYLPALSFELDLADEFGIAFGSIKGRAHLAKVQMPIAQLLSKELRHIHQN